MGFWTEVASFIGAMSGSLELQMICSRCGTMCPERRHGFCGEGECMLFGADKPESEAGHSREPASSDTPPRPPLLDR